MVGKDKYVVVKFYTRWCGYCRIMAPEYDKLVDIVKEKREDVIVARLEGSINEDISMIYEIFSFPKVVLFYPGSVDIRSNFRGQRLAPVMFSWIEQNAPKIEKQNLKMLEGEPVKAADSLVEVEKNLRNLDKTKAYDLQDAIGSGKNATGEIEFLKIEMLNMKNRIINLEKDIEDLKNSTRKMANYNFDKINYDDENNEFKANNITQDDLAMKLKLIKEKKRLAEGFFDKINTFDVFVYIGIILLLIAAVITIKKILFKKNKGVSNDHVKV